MRLSFITSIHYSDQLHLSGVAWSEVEEVAASGNANAMGTVLSMEECDIDFDETCRAFEELERLFEAQKKA
jgi:hypothetical protein